MSDLLTMIWKETKDSVLSGGRSAWIRPLIFIFLLGILVPWQLGHNWLALNSSPIAILVACYMPFFFITSYIGDAIAGERERHTLETLLASRISDQAILAGKLVVTVGYNFGLTIAGLLIGFIVANLPQGQGSWTFYQPLGLLGETLLLSFLISLVAASGGALVSLRAPTARQAQQTMSVGVIVLFLAIVFILKAIPSAVLQSLNASLFLLVLMGVFFLIDLILLSILAANFRRARLILS